MSQMLEELKNWEKVEWIEAKVGRWFIRVPRTPKGEAIVRDFLLAAKEFEVGI